ncbi:MAG: BamA/TamA family outer membrane protein [Holophagales bacterium]|nr:BamA/TamA family outer membrane protein [Holophagales bacterium]
MTRIPVRTGAAARSTILASFAALALLVVAVPAEAQYYTSFGKNKVQYREFDWRIYHSPHFDVYYYTEDEALLQKMVSVAESAYDELSRIFDYQIQEPTPLIAYETHSAFLQTNVILAGVPEGAQAFATSSKFRIVMPMDQPDKEMQTLVRHELTHIFQYHILFRGRLGGGLRGQPPLWFIEGMASYFGQDEQTADKKYMIDAVVNDNIPSVQVQGGGFFAYRFGNAMFSYIEERWGREAILDFVYEFRNTFGSRIGKAIERTFRMDVEDFDSEFRRWARRKYLPALLETGEPGDFGRPYRLDRGRIGHEMAPAASPSGDLVAALTTDIGDLDISLFDTQTRRRIRNLTKGLDTEIRGITVRTNREIGSDLAFSPDGNYIAAFGRREAGRSLLLFDVLKGGLSRIVDMPGVEQQRSPAFSPDGRYVAFAGNIAGTNDIFLIDLETLEITNITRDELFDAAPAFSPDGKTLAYTTYVGEHAQIFRLELADPDTRFQVTDGEYNNKEPAYSPDGGRMYFTSDRSGADNIYSLDFDTGQVMQYTNAITGCDRPTVLPLPGGGERLVYASYWKGRFGLFTTDVEEPLGEPETVEVPEEPAVIADLPRFEPDIEVTLDSANDEELTGFNFFLEDAQSTLGVDTNQVFVGRILLSFTDYLGDRRILANLAAVDTFSDFDLTYLDQRKRRQWALRLFDTRFFAFSNDQGLLDPFNRNLERDQIYSLTGVEYTNIFPLSFNKRFEVSLGYYYRDIEQSLGRFDDAGNFITIYEPGSDDYPQLSAAFVSDNTVYNQWGPATGHRLRVSGSYAPDLDDSGTLISTLQLDARQYVPLTRRSNLAFRLYGYDSDGNTPNVIFIGGLDTIRGFDTRSIGGTRAFFANAEVRFPLIDRLAFPGFAFDGIRGVIFFDVGSAWFPEDGDWDFLDDDDRLDDAFAVYGWGFSMRLFGLPVQWDFSMRTDLKDDLDDSFETNFWIGTRF